MHVFLAIYTVITKIKAIVLIGHVCPADSKCTIALIHNVNLLHLQAI